MPARPRAVIAWSSGKDSAWALWVARQLGEVEVVGALTTLTDAFGRVSMHAVREELLDRQLQAAGLPCTKVWIPSPCTNAIYEQRMGEAVAKLRGEGISHVIFGDLFLADVRAYREAQLAPAGMHALFPLWGQGTAELAREMLAAGLRAVITCVDPRQVDAKVCGRELDARLLGELPAGVDPCGERGEFHTVVTAGPMLSEAIDVEVGEVVERDGFVFADVIPTAASPRAPG